MLLATQTAADGAATRKMATRAEAATTATGRLLRDLQQRATIDHSVWIQANRASRRVKHKQPAMAESIRAERRCIIRAAVTFAFEERASKDATIPQCAANVREADRIFTADGLFKHAIKQFIASWSSIQTWTFKQQCQSRWQKARFLCRLAFPCWHCHC